MRSGNRFVEPCSACGKQIQRRGIKTDRAAVCTACKTERRKANAEDRRLREAIDWLVVDLVVTGESMKGLTTDEVRMVVRRLADKMPLFNESPGHDIPPWQWTYTKLGALLHMTPNNLQKISSRLPKATKRRCPECRGGMWVLENGAIEEHGNGFYERCPMSGMKGLAATRPDLYQWAVSA